MRRGVKLRLQPSATSDTPATKSDNESSSPGSEQQGEEVALTTQMGEETEGGVSVDKFTVRTSATDSKGGAIEYPNTWQLTNGNPEENWQAILVYLEERYGNQKNKNIKMAPYSEDIANLNYLLKMFPDRLAAKVWADKLNSSNVVKARVAQTKIAGSKSTVDNSVTGDAGIYLDKSFNGSLSEGKIQSNRSIDDLCPVELLGLAKSQKLSADDFESIKSKYRQEADKEKRLILIKIIQQSGENNYFKI